MKRFRFGYMLEGKLLHTTVMAETLDKANRKLFDQYPHISQIVSAREVS